MVCLLDCLEKTRTRSHLYHRHPPPHALHPRTLAAMHPESEHDILKLDLSRLETLGVVFNSIVSMMLGFCIYGRLSTLRTDARFLKELLEYDRPIAILTRSVYFASRYLCIGYLVAQVALIDGRRHVSCAPISLFIVATFYLLLIFNHWLFASRLLAVWHGHAHRRFIQAYIGIGFVLLVATVVVVGKVGEDGNVAACTKCPFRNRTLAMHSTATPSHR